MSSQDIPSYLNDPPVYDNFFEKIDLDGKEMVLNDSWSNWFDNIVESLGQCVTHDFVVDPVKYSREDKAVLMATSGSTAERNMLENARDGSFWYNTDTKTMNVRANGSWFSISVTPA